MKKVSSEYNGILWCVNSMNPARGNKKCVALFKKNSATVFDKITKKLL